MNADEVLDAIDSACEDWRVGPDAMRSGGQVPAPAARPVVSVLATDVCRWFDIPMARLYGDPSIVAVGYGGGAGSGRRRDAAG